MNSLTVFLDASVILSGLASPAGGSAMLFLASKKKKIKLITTPLVLNEAVRHLEKMKIIHRISRSNKYRCQFFTYLGQKTSPN